MRKLTISASAIAIVISFSFNVFSAAYFSPQFARACYMGDDCDMYFSSTSFTVSRLPCQTTSPSCTRIYIDGSYVWQAFGVESIYTIWAVDSYVDDPFGYYWSIPGDAWITSCDTETLSFPYYYLGEEVMIDEWIYNNLTPFVRVSYWDDSIDAWRAKELWIQPDQY
jgi:hypothetical protein